MRNSHESLLIKNGTQKPALGSGRSFSLQCIRLLNSNESMACVVLSNIMASGGSYSV